MLKIKSLTVQAVTFAKIQKAHPGDRKKDLLVI